MRAPLLALLLSVTPLSSNAQDTVPFTPAPASAPTAPGATASPATGRITGLVLCSDTRRPARGALVMLVTVPSASSDTAGVVAPNGIGLGQVRNDGTYLIEHLAPGDYAAMAVLPGYLSPLSEVISHQGETDRKQLREQLLQMGTVSVRNGAQAKLDITLQRGAALSGQVLYSDGAPAASVTLILEGTKLKPSSTGSAAEQQQMTEEMAQRLFSHQTMSTDDQGRFRLAGLRPGVYRLASTQPTSASLSGTVDGDEAQGIGILLGMPDARALRFYAGDTTHRAAAKTFELHAGEEVSGIQITLPTDAFHEIRGTVAAQDGRLITQGQISLTDTADPLLIFHATINNDGGFRISQVPAGSYTLGSTNGRIREVIPGGPAGAPERYQPHKTVAAFADASQPILVQDHDLEGINLTVTEIPLPKDEATPAVGSPDIDD